MNELRDIFTKYKAVVFFDTETTGLEAESCQIIELAAIRVEKTERGTLRMADSADVFVKLPEGERIPQKIVELTGITDEQLENEGITEAEAAARFTELISGGRVLLVAHNAQFDLLFTAEMLRRHGNGGPEALKAADYLDSLTVYKDRRAYPHKLANAILTYKLEGKVQNSHRAIDDVAALFEVCKAMDAERSDLLNYVNVFGYNPKYGVSGKRIEKVAYWPQNFNKYMQAPSYTLPAKLRQRRRVTEMRSSSLKVYSPVEYTGYKEKRSGHPSEPGSRTGNRKATRKPKPILYRLRRFCKRLNWKRIGGLAVTTVVIVFAARGVVGMFSEHTQTKTAPVTTSSPAAEESQPYVFYYKDGQAVSWEDVTDAWAAEAGIQKRYALTDAERLEIAQVLTAEAGGEPFAGKIAVAQCILQTCEDEGIRPDEVLRVYAYSKRRPEPTQEALEAVQDVFDFGIVATTEPIKYFYAPALTDSEWHESQIYVMTINGHRFFKEATE